MTRIRDTLHEDMHAIMTVSPRILLRMTDILDIICR